jgi:pimeloyl-ACP methyl ester carboxylesterase
MTTTDPRTLAYEIHGEGTPVVLLHGLMFDRSTWKPVVERLGDGVQSIAFDLPGHGQTGGEPASIDEVVEALGNALDILGIEDPVLVGHSIAAVIALRYAAARPVRGVVDVDQRLNPRPFAELVQRIAPALRGDDFRSAFQPFQDGMGLERLDAPTRAHIQAIQQVDRDLVLPYWDELLTTEPERLQANAEEVMSALDAPFLGIFAHELVPPERSFLLDNLADAELEGWPEVGTHFIQLAEPDRFTERLQEFVARVG